MLQIVVLAAAALGLFDLGLWSTGSRLFALGVSMKPASAFAVTLEAVAQYLRGHRSRNARAFALGLSLLVAGMMHGLILAQFAIASVDPSGRAVHRLAENAAFPSLATCLAFLLLSAAGVVWGIMGNRAVVATLHSCAFALGGVAAIGHLSGAPLLYFEFEPGGNAVSLHTGIAIAVLGWHGAMVTLRPSAERYSPLRLSDADSERRRSQNR